MSHRFVFIHPKTLISVFREVAGENVRLIFRRFTPSGHEPGMHVVEMDDRAADQYVAGGYTEMYLTLGMVPDHPQDWDFWDRVVPEVLVIEGCRVKDNVLEKTYIRIVARVSRAEPLYHRIDRRLKKFCRKGMGVVGSHSKYPHTWYDPKVLSMELRSSLDWPESVYYPLPEEELQALRKRKKPDSD